MLTYFSRLLNYFTMWNLIYFQTVYVFSNLWKYFTLIIWILVKVYALLSQLLVSVCNLTIGTLSPIEDLDENCQRYFQKPSMRSKKEWNKELKNLVYGLNASMVSY